MNLQQKPALVNIIAWTTLTSGVVNLIWGMTAVSTTFLGVICAPVFILQIILGAFELVYAAKLLGTSLQNIKPSTNIAAFEIACILAGNVFSMAVGIISLVFYNDTVVKEYFARLNGALEPVNVTPAAPLSVSQPEVASIMEEPILSEDEGSSLPSAEEIETPAKPRRTSRKSTDQ